MADEDSKVVRHSFLLGAKAMILTGPLNVLLVCTIVAFVSQGMKLNEGVTFIFALLAIAPFAERLGFVTEQLALHTNESIGGLLNATFGNATELIVAVSALANGLYRLVQLSLLGSILSNILLVLGTAFWVGGSYHKTLTFRTVSAQVNCTLLCLGAMAVLFPTVLTWSASEDFTGEVVVSRISALILFSLYLAFLYFQIVTHPSAYEELKGTDDDTAVDTEAGLTLAVAGNGAAVSSEVMMAAMLRRISYLERQLLGPDRRPHHDRPHRQRRHGGGDKGVGGDGVVAALLADDWCDDGNGSDSDLSMDRDRGGDRDSNSNRGSNKDRDRGGDGDQRSQAVVDGPVRSPIHTPPEGGFLADTLAAVDGSGSGGGGDGKALHAYAKTSAQKESTSTSGRGIGASLNSTSLLQRSGQGQGQGLGQGQGRGRGDDIEIGDVDVDVDGGIRELGDDISRVDTDPDSVDRLMPAVSHNSSGHNRGNGHRPGNGRSYSHSHSHSHSSDRGKAKSQNDAAGAVGAVITSGTVGEAAASEATGREGEKDEEKEEEEDVLGFWYAILWLAVITVFISFLSDALVESINEAAASAGASGIFLSTIVIPIVGNAAEHASSIMAAAKNKCDLALGIAVGSSTQICLCVLPLLVIIGWCIDKPLTMNFQPFEAFTLVLTVIMLAYTISHGTVSIQRSSGTPRTGWCWSSSSAHLSEIRLIALSHSFSLNHLLPSSPFSRVYLRRLRGSWALRSSARMPLSRWDSGSTPTSHWRNTVERIDSSHAFGTTRDD